MLSPYRNFLCRLCIMEVHDMNICDDIKGRKKLIQNFEKMEVCLDDQHGNILAYAVKMTSISNY